MEPNQKSAIEAFEERISYCFKSKVLLLTALTHRSYAKQIKNQHIEDNERLEFFGDAIMKFLVSEYLFDQNPDYSEGDLSKLRAKIVSDKNFAQFAIELELSKVLRVSEGERKLMGHEKLSILSCAFEAVIAAIYLDGGIDEVKTLVQRLLEELSLESLEHDLLESKSFHQDDLSYNTILFHHEFHLEKQDFFLIFLF